MRMYIHEHLKHKKFQSTKISRSTVQANYYELKYAYFFEVKQMHLVYHKHQYNYSLSIN